MLIGIYIVRMLSRVPRAPCAFWVDVCGAHASPTPQFFVRGDPTVWKLEAIVTIEALAFWFRSNVQQFLHNQLHGPTRSL